MGVVILVSSMLMACVAMEERALSCFILLVLTDILMNMICGLCYEVVLCCSACVAGDTQELDMELHLPEGWNFSSWYVYT